MERNGDVTEVWNPVQGTWSDSTTWRVKQLLRIPVNDHPAVSTFVGLLMMATEGPDGAIFVLDSEPGSLTRFSPEGRFLDTVAKRGQLPGELRAPSGMGWDAHHRLWVADFGARYTLFDQSGRFLRTQPRPVHTVPRRQHLLIVRDDGTLLDESGRWAPDGSSPETLFLAVDSSAIPKVDTVGELILPALSDAARNLRLIEGTDIYRTIFAYSIRRYWAFAADETLWQVDTNPLRLVRRNLHGDTIALVHTSHRQMRLGIMERFRNWFALRRAGLKSDAIPLGRPVTQSLYVLPDGFVLVQIVEQLGDDSAVFDVFDSDGIYLGAMDWGFAPSAVGVVTFRGDTLLAPSMGTDGTAYIVEAVIERRH